MRNAIRAVWNVVTWFTVILFMLLAVTLVGVRILGFTPYAVLSPSMTPQYQVGDLVYVKAVEPETIEVGEAISYVANEDLLVVTHRVVEIDQENRRFTTKGDANQSTDARPVLYENVLGVVVFSLPKLGYVSMYLTTPSGKYVAMAIGFSLLLIFLLPELFKAGKEKVPCEENGKNSKPQGNDIDSN